MTLSKTADNHQKGERGLWLSVIWQSLLDAQAEPTSQTTDHAINAARERTKARNWFLRPSRDFDTVCSLAGLDPSAVRERVKLIFEGKADEKPTLKPIVAPSAQASNDADLLRAFAFPDKVMPAKRRRFSISRTGKNKRRSTESRRKDGVMAHPTHPRRKLYLYGGSWRTIEELAARSPVPIATLRHRLRYGEMSIEEAVETPQHVLPRGRGRRQLSTYS